VGKIESKIKILEYPNLFLIQRTIIVKSLKDTFVLKTIAALKIGMGALDEGAAGLSANQIGEPYRIFAYRCLDNDKIFIIVNPKIVAKSNKYLPSVEKCLSFPKKKQLMVKRFSEITVKYQKENGKNITEIITAESDNRKLFVWQHEIDHLDGILFNQADKAWKD
jgi:peptide deformylase